MRREPITCEICHYQDFTDNRDLDSDIHEGFTIGKGKKMYWSMIWHASSGNVTVYAIDDDSRRYISGGSMITIHFKETDNDQVS
jgi:hypothetical protein